MDVGTTTKEMLVTLSSMTKKERRISVGYPRSSAGMQALATTSMRSTNMQIDLLLETLYHFRLTVREDYFEW